MSICSASVRACAKRRYAAGVRQFEMIVYRVGKEVHRKIINPTKVTINYTSLCFKHEGILFDMYNTVNR